MKKIVYPLSFFLLLIFSLDCKKDDSYKDNISLTATRDTMDKNKITLSWSLSYHKDFVKYHLVSSIDSTLSDVKIPGEIIPDSVNIITFGDQLTNQYVDEEKKPGFDLYYKLYIEREDGVVLSSPTVKVSTFAKIVNIEYAHSAEIPGTTHLLLSSIDGRVVKYDYVQNKILHEVVLDAISYPFIRVGDAGNGLEIFISGMNGQKLYVLDINDLSVKATQVFHFNIYDLTTSTKGFLFASRSNFPDKYIYSIRRSDWGIQDSILTTTALNRSVKVLNSNDSTLFYFSSLFCYANIFNSDGFFTGGFIDGNITFGGDLKRDISVSPSGTHLLPSTDGPIVGPQLNFVSHIIDITPPFIDLESSVHTFENDATVYMYHSEEKSLVLFDIFARTYTILYSQIKPLAVYRTETQVIAIKENISSYPSKTEVLVLNK